MSPSNYQPINNYVHEAAARPTATQGLSPAAGTTDAHGGRASEPSVVAVTSASRIDDANDPLVQTAARAFSHASGLSNGDAANHDDEDGSGLGAAADPTTGKSGGGSKKAKGQPRAKAPAASEKKGPWHAGLECDDVTRANVARLNPAVYLKKRMPPKITPEFSALTTPAQRILHAQLFDRGIYEHELAEGARLGQQERINAAAETARIRTPLPADKSVAELVSLLALPDIPWSVFKRAPHCPSALKTHYEALSPNERRLIRMNWHVIDVRSEAEMQDQPRNGLIGAVFCRVVPDSDGVISEWKEPHIHELALTKIHMKTIVKEEEEFARNGQAGFVHLTRGSIQDTLRHSAFTSGQNAIAQTMAEKGIEGMVIGELARRGATGGDAPVLALTHVPTAPPPAAATATTTVTTTQTRLQLVPAPAPAPARPRVGSAPPAPAPAPRRRPRSRAHRRPLPGRRRAPHRRRTGAAAPATAPAAAVAPPAPAPVSGRHDHVRQWQEETRVRVGRRAQRPNRPRRHVARRGGARARQGGAPRPREALQARASLARVFSVDGPTRSQTHTHTRAHAHLVLVSVHRL